MGSRLSAVLAFPTPCPSPSALGMSPAARTLMGANYSIWAVGSKSVCPPGFRPLTDSPSCDITAVRICVCVRNGYREQCQGSCKHRLESDQAPDRLSPLSGGGVRQRQRVSSVNRCLVSEILLPEDCWPCGQFLRAAPLPSHSLSCPRSSTLSYPLSNIALSSVVFGYDCPVA
ncbi:hypothetical protein QQF64_012439 [Cirrhinus molitorella]|uniref:Uncharacterized protein n=1 Tax=Cirrhinus molitorella TaxID=172907 RepID=A0ABR3LVJ8_9TELE